MDDRENFEKWMKQWAEAEKQMAQEAGKEVPEPEPLRTSYFTGTPAEQDFVDNSDNSSNDDWHDIYRRAMEIDYTKETLITDSTNSVNVAYAGSEGYGLQSGVDKPKLSKEGKKAYVNNPIHFASVGNDQEDDEGHVRVTGNFSDGKEIRELDEIKRRVEEMERKFHEADVLNKKTERSKLQNELKKLRDRVKQLSEKMVSDPQSDLA